ncbi:MAG: hypothetical protein JWM68_1233, partial [Verrucomicrobiales bacterium]|nr:hypothetical protein [Verrucomicrobiales bacterium]
LQEVWDTAVKAVKTATRIIVIGFSMPQTDVHFKYLMAAGLQDNVSLRQIAFVNQDSGPVTKSKINDTFRKDYVGTDRIPILATNVADFLSIGGGGANRIDEFNRVLAKDLIFRDYGHDGHE